MEGSVNISSEIKLSTDGKQQFLFDLGLNPEDTTLDKQEVFDRFLTYRRRMARMSAVQALYLYDIRKKNNINQGDNLFESGDIASQSVQLCEEVISFYQNVFFTPEEYGDSKKNKKIDEQFMFELVNTALNNIDEIDGYIKTHINSNWTIDKLDYILRAIIRCAIAEILIGAKIEKAVLSSEYTNLASDYFNGKEIGFINGIVDRLYTSVLKRHPFV